MYNINLQDFKSKKQVNICIDDYIPCQSSQWLTTEAKPLFAQSIGGEMQVNLIEKAFAKYSGQYSNLISGQMMKALSTMTGCEDNINWTIANGEASCKWMTIEADRQNDTPLSEYFHSGYLFSGYPKHQDKRGLESTKINMQEFFDKLKQQDEQNQVICTAKIGASDTDKGIIGNHAQSVISVHQQGEIKLIRLRNPHAKNEWKGKWEDNDYHKWDSEPQIKNDLWCDQVDGLFYMELEDFFKFFTTVEILLMSMDGYKGRNQGSGENRRNQSGGNNHDREPRDNRRNHQTHEFKVPKQTFNQKCSQQSTDIKKRFIEEQKKETQERKKCKKKNREQKNLKKTNIKSHR